MPAPACAKCGRILQEKAKACPFCGSTSLSTDWVGYVEVQALCECGHVPRPGEKTCPKCGGTPSLKVSQVASRLGLTQEGKYALKVRE
jgi:RNA polymerase subunit RPABC4/transcription elongation factor Spt4